MACNPVVRSRLFATNPDYSRSADREISRTDRAPAGANTGEPAASAGKSGRTTVRSDAPDADRTPADSADTWVVERLARHARCCSAQR
jgi:hypothetical protein